MSELLDLYKSIIGKINEINKKIRTGTAVFSVAVFDVNGLKITNDRFGHECGDRIIADMSSLVCREFGQENVFRIGGDEFIALNEGMTEPDLEARFARLTEDLERFNLKDKSYVMPLSFSFGGTVYIPGEDTTFQEVFRRADQKMYKSKGDFYQNRKECCCGFA